MTWEAHRPDRYVVQTCTLAIEPAGCVRAAISAGKVLHFQERIYDEGLGWEDFMVDEDPIDTMFANSMNPPAGCKRDSVKYDPKYGFPSDYKLHCDGLPAGRHVACFESDTTDIERCDVTP